MSNVWCYTVITLPAFNELAQSLAANGSAAITLIPGLIAYKLTETTSSTLNHSQNNNASACVTLAATDIPLIIPPPPTLTTIASRSGTYKI